MPRLGSKLPQLNSSMPIVTPAWPSAAAWAGRVSRVPHSREGAALALNDSARARPPMARAVATAAMTAIRRRVGLPSVRVKNALTVLLNFRLRIMTLSSSNPLHMISVS